VSNVLVLLDVFLDVFLFPLFPLFSLFTLFTLFPLFPLFPLFTLFTLFTLSLVSRRCLGNLSANANYAQEILRRGAIEKLVPALRSDDVGYASRGEILTLYNALYNALISLCSLSVLSLGSVSRFCLSVLSLGSVSLSLSLRPLSLSLRPPPLSLFNTGVNEWRRWPLQTLRPTYATKLGC
jgi:hypothetical protein